MRGRALFIGFIALNAAFAVALIAFVAKSGGDKSSAPPPPATLASTAPPGSNTPPAAAPAPAKPSAPAPAATPVPSNAPAVAVAKVPPSMIAGRTFGWQEIESTNYLGYLANLRGVGCPEKAIRQIIFNDANELFNQQRLQAAVSNDFKWWQSDNALSAGGYNPEFQSRMQNLVQERRELLTRLLGANWEEEDKTPSLANHTVALTGPVLGALTPETYLGVQEICSRSMSRHNDYLMSRFNEGQASSQIELAKLRDQTRKDLATILDKDQLEEFLLRFSHNASKLRLDLRGMGLTADEFRKVFRATDQIDHQIQLEYGGEEALSPKQREQLARQREQALAGALGQERYSKLILGRDPLYQRARRVATENGIREQATQALYEVFKETQSKRLQIQADRKMTPDQKQDALVAINQEELRRQKKIIDDN